MDTVQGPILVSHPERPTPYTRPQAAPEVPVGFFDDTSALEAHTPLKDLYAFYNIQWEVRSQPFLGGLEIFSRSYQSVMHLQCHYGSFKIEPLKSVISWKSGDTLLAVMQVLKVTTGLRQLLSISFIHTDCLPTYLLLLPFFIQWQHSGIPEAIIPAQIDSADLAYFVVWYHASTRVHINDIIKARLSSFPEFKAPSHPYDTSATRRFFMLEDLRYTLPAIFEVMKSVVCGKDELSSAFVPRLRELFIDEHVDRLSPTSDAIFFRSSKLDAIVISVRSDTVYIVSMSAREEEDYTRSLEWSLALIMLQCCMTTGITQIAHSPYYMYPEMYAVFRRLGFRLAENHVMYYEIGPDTIRFVLRHIILDSINPDTSYGEPLPSLLPINWPVGRDTTFVDSDWFGADILDRWTGPNFSANKILFTRQILYINSTRAYYNTLSEYDRMAVLRYIRNGTPLNALWRFGVPIEETWKQGDENTILKQRLIFIINNAPPLPFDLQVFRGVDTRFSSTLSRLVNMRSFRERAFLSTSVDKSVTKVFTPYNGIVMTMNLPTGSRLGFFIGAIVDTEAEFVLCPDLTYTFQMSVTEGVGKDVPTVVEYGVKKIGYRL